MSAISSLSRETVWFPVTDTNPIGVPTNPTTQSVRLALTTGANPVALDWMTAAWEATPIVINEVSYYLARVEVGPGTPKTLAKGNYNLWIEINISTPPIIAKGQVLQVY